MTGHSEVMFSSTAPHAFGGEDAAQSCGLPMAGFPGTDWQLRAVLRDSMTLYPGAEFAEFRSQTMRWASAQDEQGTWTRNVKRNQRTMC